MTDEQKAFILEKYGLYSYQHMMQELQISIDDIIKFLRSRKKFKPRIPYAKRSQEWKEEIAEYIKSNSLSSASEYFCVSGTILQKIIEEFNIQLPSRKDVLEKTRLKHYGSHDNYVREMVESSRVTSLSRYGVDNYASTEEAKEKCRNTCLQKYGVDNPMKNDDIKQKYQSNMIEKFGVAWPMQNSELQAKMKNTYIDRYGGLGWQSDLVKDKTKQTMFNKYGSMYSMQVEDLRGKANKTIFNKYGVLWNCQRPEAKNYSNNSTPNLQFEVKLQDEGIAYVREFPINKFSFDFKINNFLVEIDPTATHNSTFGIHGDPMLKEYHKIKSQCAASEGYSCIHIWDWDDQNKIIQLIKQRDRIVARKCEICEVSIEESAEFINKYHLQNYVKDQVRIGLYYQNQLVSIMTFGKPRYNKNYQYELLRYCSSMNIVGGAEKLFAYFIKSYNPESIISYCDKSKFTGNVYKKLGFNSLGDPNPSKHWYNMKTGRHITDNLLRQRGFDQLFGTNYGKGTSNEQLMLEYGFVEIYDCGQETFIWRITK